MPEVAPDDDVAVWKEGGLWHLTRGDFRASWDPKLRRGQIRQSPNPYSVDTVLRMMTNHGLALTADQVALAKHYLVQAYPAKPVRVIVPQAPGDSCDVLSPVALYPLTPWVTPSHVAAGRVCGFASSRTPSAAPTRSHTQEIYKAMRSPLWVGRGSTALV